MGENIIIPSLTNDMILSVFKYLVDAELRKSRALDFRFGCQEGAIATLSIMFGNASEDVAEASYDSGTTWLQVTERIVDEKLSSWTDAMANDDDTINFDQMIEDISQAVDKFALENPTLVIDALKKNL